MLLPHLKGKIALGTVVNQTALSANHVKAKFGFEKAATNWLEVFAGIEQPAVLISTRHNLHGSMVVRALADNRHVFVEKPLCISPKELQEIDQAHAKSKGSVMVGYNRRFAPASAELKKILASAPGPKTASFRVIPGKLDPQHWYANYAESGGRVIGEACHFLDYFCFLFDSTPVRLLAQTTWPATGRLPFPDSVTAQVEFADGSCGQLVYSAEGDPGYPKETLAVYGAGAVCEMTNFQKLVVHRGRRKTSASFSSKGHAEEMAAWAQFLRGKAEHPLPYQQSRTSMLLTFAVLESIQEARAVELRA
jgi:predicted dehydrogenase